MGAENFTLELSEIFMKFLKLLEGCYS